MVNFWSGKRVFITGHTGFKGGWLTLWLEKLGARITGYSLEPPTKPSFYELSRVNESASTIIGDVRDIDTLQRAMVSAEPEIVFHLAAQSLVRPSYTDPVGTYATNVLGTANVLDAVRATQTVHSVLNITSDKCYENREWIWGYRESDRLGGHDPYSNSKACSELLTQAFRDSFFSPASVGGRPVAVASCRAGNVIGGGDWATDRLLADFIRAILERRAVRIRNPNAVRPWQHVLDPLSGYLRLAECLTLEGQRWAEAWNFGPEEGNARSVAWMVDHLTMVWGDGAKWERDTGIHPKEAGMLRLDISKARQKLGWAPTWDIERALQKTVAWYKAYAKNADLRALSIMQIGEFEREAKSIKSE
jgi:CDP-glucose 4,6-dehydratase